VLGAGNDVFQLSGSGTGAFNLDSLASQFTGFSTFNVVGATWAATASCSSGAKAGTGACAARAAAPDMSIVPPVDSSATRGAAPAEQANKSARTKPITIGSHVSTTRA